MPCIFNSRKKEFKTPFGAVEAGQEVMLAICVPKEMACKTPMLFLEKEGQPPVQYPMLFTKSQGDEDHFAVKVTPGFEGLYFYWFDLWVDFKKLYMGKNAQAVLQVEEGQKYPLVVYKNGFETPKAAQGAVMYQIFPDRFFEGNPEKPLCYNERIYRQDKHNEPYFWHEERSYGSLTQDYYGGDFAGIQKRLPYLKSLGVQWVYLNPIFEAHSNHRYNTADYLKADPYLGTNQDFASLCQEAKKVGISIILDGVFSHTGSDSVYFNKDGRYPSVGAWQGPQSPYRDWFKFNPDGSYESWWGFKTLPTCNKNNPHFRQFITGEGGVIDYWLSLGAAGFRLDVADELPDDFIAEIRTAVKRGGKDKLLIGEVWEDAALKEAYGLRRKYFLGDELDGVMNYPFRTAILQFLKDNNADNFEEAVMPICENYPPQALAACTVHLSTHDTVRAITALVGEEPNGKERNWQSGRKLSADQLHMGIVQMRLAFVLQFTLPGIPCVYYGDEIAMQGYADPFNRGYYDWGSSENRLMELMAKLSELRNNCPAFKCGSLQFIKANSGVLVYRRQGGGQSAEIAINCSGWPTAVCLMGQEVSLPNMGFAIKSSNASLQLNND